MPALPFDMQTKLYNLCYLRTHATTATHDVSHHVSSFYTSCLCSSLICCFGIPEFKFSFFVHSHRCVSFPSDFWIPYPFKLFPIGLV